MLEIIKAASAALCQPLLRAAGNFSLNMVYPRTCLGCGLLIEAQSSGQAMELWLCTYCRAQLNPIEPPFCDCCGEPFSGKMDSSFLCPNCQGRQLAFDYAISAYKAEGPLRELIHGFKYNRDLALRGVLTDAIALAFQDPRLRSENLSDWLLVPVPLHWSRQLYRGFNQSWELCRQLSKQAGIPAKALLRRSRRTPRQVRLSRNQRLENMRGVFAPSHGHWLSQHINPQKHWPNVLLIDDVLTTGATAHECARVLRAHFGVQKVVVITAARA